MQMRRNFAGAKKRSLYWSGGFSKAAENKSNYVYIYIYALQVSPAAITEFC